MKRKILKGFALLLFSMFFLHACKKEDDNTKISVKMTDDPFPVNMINAANIGLAKIELKDSSGNYVTVFNGNTEINMINYTNGVTTEVSVNSVPEGNYTEARISLNGASVELSDGRIFQAPGSASNTYQVKIYPPVVVPEGETAELLIDMDLSDSFGFQASGWSGWIDDITDITGLSFFSADFRAVNLAQTGSIEGSVTDSNGNNVAYAYVQVQYDYDGDGQAESVSTIADANGYYAIIGLPQGTYTVSAESGNANGSISNVEVNAQHNIAANLTIN